MKTKSLIEACNCFAARQAARSISQLYERHLAPAGVTITQFSILVLLGERPGITAAELAEAMVMERTTLLRTLMPLRRDGLIGNAVDGGLKAKLVLSLTVSGRKTLNRATPFWLEAQAEFAAQIGSKRADSLRHALLDVTQDVRDLG